MIIAEDSRQKKGMHELKHNYWKKIGAQVIKVTLPFGDYACIPPILVDTKRDIYEIVGNIEHDHERFRKECIKAQECGCKLVILVENLDGVKNLDDLSRWRESEEHFRKRNGVRRYSGKRAAAAMRTMTGRYGVEWDFCTPNEAGRRVLEILGGDGACQTSQ